MGPKMFQSGARWEILTLKCGAWLTQYFFNARGYFETLPSTDQI